MPEDISSNFELELDHMFVGNVHGAGNNTVIATSINDEPLVQKHLSALVNNFRLIDLGEASSLKTIRDWRKSEEFSSFSTYLADENHRTFPINDPGTSRYVVTSLVKPIGPNVDKRSSMAYHWIILSPQDLVALAGNWDLIFRQVQDDAHRLESEFREKKEPFYLIDPLVITSEEIDIASRENLQRLYTLFPLGERSNELELLVSSLFEQQPVFIQGLPAKRDERVSFAVALAALLPPALRGYCTFTTRVLNTADISKTHFKFLPENESETRSNICVYDWETNQFRGNQPLSVPFVKRLIQAYQNGPEKLVFFHGRWHRKSVRLLESGWPQLSTFEILRRRIAISDVLEDPDEPARPLDIIEAVRHATNDTLKDIFDLLRTDRSLIPEERAQWEEFVTRDYIATFPAITDPGVKEKIYSMEIFPQVLEKASFHDKGLDVLRVYDDFKTFRGALPELQKTLTRNYSHFLAEEETEPTKVCEFLGFLNRKGKDTFDNALVVEVLEHQAQAMLKVGPESEVHNKLWEEWCFETLSAQHLSVIYERDPRITSLMSVSIRDCFSAIFQVADTVSPAPFFEASASVPPPTRDQTLLKLSLLANQHRPALLWRVDMIRELMRIAGASPSEPRTIESLYNERRLSAQALARGSELLLEVASNNAESLSLDVANTLLAWQLRRWPSNSAPNLMRVILDQGEDPRAVIQGLLDKDKHLSKKGILEPLRQIFNTLAVYPDQRLDYFYALLATHNHINQWRQIPETLEIIKAFDVDRSHDFNDRDRRILSDKLEGLYLQWGLENQEYHVLRWWGRIFFLQARRTTNLREAAEWVAKAYPIIDENEQRDDHHDQIARIVSSCFGDLEDRLDQLLDAFQARGASLEADFLRAYQAYRQFNPYGEVDQLIEELIASISVMRRFLGIQQKLDSVTSSEPSLRYLRQLLERDIQSLEEHQSNGLLNQIVEWRDQAEEVSKQFRNTKQGGLFSKLRGGQRTQEINFLDLIATIQQSINRR